MGQHLKVKGKRDGKLFGGEMSNELGPCYFVSYLNIRRKHGTFLLFTVQSLMAIKGN